MLKTSVSISKSVERGYRLPYTVTMYQGAECIKKVSCDTLVGAKAAAREMRAIAKLCDSEGKNG